MILAAIRAATTGHERGQGLVEYSLVLTVVSIALVGALMVFGNQSNGLYGHIQTALAAVAASL